MFKKKLVNYEKTVHLINSNYYDLHEWIDNNLSNAKLKKVVAFCFNIYELTDDSYAMDLVGTSSFDPDDDDWACDEVTDFNSRNPYYRFKVDGVWKKVLNYICKEIKEYLENGKYSSVLKSKECVAVGFADGNLKILYQNKKP